MQVREMTTRECREVLARTKVGRLACARENQPYIVPIQTYLDGDYLYSFAALGQKIAWMRENPQVCVEIEEAADRFQWSAVVVFGSYEELVHTPTYEDARQRARELFEQLPEWWQPASTKTALHENVMPVVYRIRIDRITGRVATRSEPPVEGLAGEDAPRKRPWWLDLIFDPVPRNTDPPAE